MARLSFLNRAERPGRAREGEGDEAGAPPAQAPVARRPLPHPGQLRRERRALLRTREDRIRDLGGLVLEMYRRDQFRQDLVYEHAAELVALEGRLHELDQLLAAAVSARRTAPAARCECGAPLIWGSHFCANCGRALGEKPVVACGKCGAAVPAESKFCASCGAPVEEASPAPPPEGDLAAAPAETSAPGDEARSEDDRRDRWETD